ncbi:MAG: quinone oxidoreductase [Pseudomonadota bacterium]|nr:quinone oxidoreductase [Pseudomonadota bacterium]
MTHAIIVEEAGGPEVMQWQEINLEAPGPGQALVRQTVVGLNFIDIYQRSGKYPVKFPSSIGMEAAGVVEAVGADVGNVKPGDRVAYVMGPPGSYAEARLYPASRLIALPDDITDQQAAAMMLKGLTASYLITKTFPVKAGQTVLFHAAAGGVGLIICQWLNQLGATVIGTVGSDEKAAIATAHGCHHTINYSTEDFAARVMEITEGAGVPVVYDGVGAATYEGSLASLAPFGVFASFGNASGAAPAVPGTALAARALYFTRPGLAPHTATPALTESIATPLFEAVRQGVKIEVNQTFALRDVGDAHRALEGRQTTGSTLLTV